MKISSQIKSLYLDQFNKHLINWFVFILQCRGWPIYKFHLEKYFWCYFQFQFLVYCIVSCKDENKIKPNRFLWTSAWNKMAVQVRFTICCSVQNPLTNVVNIDKVFFSVDNGVMYGGKMGMHYKSRKCFYLTEITLLIYSNQKLLRFSFNVWKYFYQILTLTTNSGKYYFWNVFFISMYIHRTYMYIQTCINIDR